MKKYSIDDLSKFSLWPERLLGLKPFDRKKKTRKEVLREFEKEKWGPLLTKLKSKSLLDDADGLVHHEENILYFDKGRFKVGKALNVHKIFVSSILKIVEKHTESEPIIEMGAGYGAIILRLAKQLKRENEVYALEFTKSGQRLIKKLSENEKLDVKVGACDFTQRPISHVPLPSGSTIFTSSALYIIPKLASDFVAEIVRLRPKTVIHIEPLYEHAMTDDLYALFRKRYIELNDYNRNLLTILKDAENKGIISIIEEKPLVFGSNPLFCCSAIVWKPKKHV